MRSQKHGQPGLITVRVHQPGGPPLTHVAQFGQRQAGVIHCNRHRLAMEIAGRDHFRLPRLLIQQDNGVIVDRVQLNIDHPLRVGDGVAHRSMHLWHAAQGVGILHILRIRTAQEFAPSQ